MSKATEKTTHTPKPWRRDWNEIRGQGGVVIAVVMQPSDFPCFEGDTEALQRECDANGDLLAAAAVLLQALRDARETLEDTITTLRGSEAWDLFEANSEQMHTIDSALDRAEGGGS